MRVLISRKEEEVRAVTILPGRMTNLPPVQIRASSKEALMARVREVIDGIKSVADPRAPA